MGVLEWIGAHLIGPFISLYRAIRDRRRPDVRIVELKATGGGTYVDFSAYVQNYGTQPARVTVSAHVGGREVKVQPTVLDLLVNAPPTRVAISVPRPDLGELMHECNDETTLYDKTLTVRVAVGKRRVEEPWHEKVYDPETDRARHDVQQRYWRRGRGAETEGDRRAEAIRKREERIKRGDDNPGRYEKV